MKKIGISGNRIYLKGFNRDYVLDHYAKCIEKIDGVPVILPITGKKEVVDEYINLIDALILTGGQDVDPSLYNKELHHKSEKPSKERDEFDYMLIEKALKKQIPIIGICRGMQILNVYLGGSLHQNIEEELKSKINHEQQSDYEKAIHSIDICEGTYLYNILGSGERVNSVHHQCVDELAPNLRVAAISSGDRVIEAYEDIDNKILGVQWHPEIMYAENESSMKKIFDFLLLKRV